MAKQQAAKKEDPATEPEAVERAEAPVVEVVRPTPIIQSRIGLEVESNTVYRVNVPNNVTADDCLDEGYWAHVGLMFNPGDTLRVLPDNMKWELVLHVHNAGREFAQVIQKQYYEYSDERRVPASAARYEVDYAGTTHKWRFKRDGKVLRDGFATETLARRAAANHQMAVDRGAKG